MNVREYFEQAFPGHTYEQSRDPQDLESIPLDSNCGKECRAVIDAATRLADHVRMADGRYGASYLKEIRNIAVHVCGVYICG